MRHKIKKIGLRLKGSNVAICWPPSKAPPIFITGGRRWITQYRKHWTRWQRRGIFRAQKRTFRNVMPVYFCTTDNNLAIHMTWYDKLFRLYNEKPSNKCQQENKSLVGALNNWRFWSTPFYFKKRHIRKWFVIAPNELSFVWSDLGSRSQCSANNGTAFSELITQQPERKPGPFWSCTRLCTRLPNSENCPLRRYVV